MMVATVETSCPCLLVSKQPVCVRPGECADLTVKFDPTDDPDFRGGLSIHVIGRDPTGEIVFGTRAHLEVLARSTTRDDQDLIQIVSGRERGEP